MLKKFLNVKITQAYKLRIKLDKKRLKADRTTHLFSKLKYCLVNDPNQYLDEAFNWCVKAYFCSLGVSTPRRVIFGHLECFSYILDYSYC